MTWLDAVLGRKPKHEHRFGDWFLVERQEVLRGPFGRTESTVWWNTRVCPCGFTEMKKAEVK